jgi:hypothetical protein
VKWVAVLAAASVLWTVPVHADDADNTTDLKCLIFGMMLAGNPDPQLQGPGRLIALYFLGRLNGRTPDQDVETKATALAKTMGPGDTAATAQACTATLTSAGKVLADSTDALQKLEQDRVPKD